MRRSFWFVAGAGVSVYAMNRIRRLREAATLDGMSDRLGALVLGARMLGEEVAQGRTEAETRLREQLGLGTGTAPQLESPTGSDRRDAGAPPSDETTNHEEGSN